MEALVEARPLRRFCTIVSRGTLCAIRRGGRSFSILDAVDPTFISLFGNQIETELLADDTSKKAPNRVLLHSVAVMMAAIVVPAGARSIAMMRARLVSGRAASLDDAGVDRVRDLPLLIFRAAEWVAILVFVFDLAMQSSKVARRHPPHHLGPARAK
jgi:hypothetical protein